MTVFLIVAQDAKTKRGLWQPSASKNETRQSQTQQSLRLPRFRRRFWLRGHATPDPGETETKMRKAPLPERLRLYRKDRWLRGARNTRFLRLVESAIPKLAA
jgi:hypothetical protein